MDFELGTAIVAGLVGTAAMTVLMYMGAMMGMRMDIPMMLGTMVLRRGPAAWALGLMAHLVMGAAFFLIYAGLFDAWGLEDALVGWAALFGAVHGVVAGMAMGMMPMLHPRMVPATVEGAQDGVPAPGLFAINAGAMAPIAVLVLHAVYGTVAGGVYRL